MDYLLNMLAKQGKVLSDFDHANIYMDGKYRYRHFYT